MKTYGHFIDGAYVEPLKGNGSIVSILYNGRGLGSHPTGLFG